MSLPLPIAPPAWEMFVPQLEAARSKVPAIGAAISAQGWTLPLALLWPLAPLFGQMEIPDHENFLAGLLAENVVGAGILPATGRRRMPLAWMGLTLRDGGRLFNDLRGGCWVCGVPAVGRARDLLRSGNMADLSGLGNVLRELGQTDPLGTRLYFNFHYHQPDTACERIYLLDADAGCLHGFAFPPSALALAKLK